MIGKFTLLVCLFGLASAGNLYGGLGYGSLGYSSLGYGGYGGLGYSGLGYGHAIAPVAYSAPISYVHAPSLSSSRYSIHSSPLIKSYASPLAYSSYGSLGSLGYSAYAPSLYSGYGYGGYRKYW